MMTSTRSGIGAAPKRREDLRFLTGQGRYLDDLAFDRLSHAVLLRSPHAHARIDRIDAAAARAMPGVLAVLTAAEVAADGLQPLMPGVDANTQTGDKFTFTPQPLLAADKVRYVGEPVALVVAETHDHALDAAERVVVEYGSLPAVTTVRIETTPGVPQPGGVSDNPCFEWLTGDSAAVAAAFAGAASVVRLRLYNHRIGSNPMEPRGVVGFYDPGTSRYTAHVCMGHATTPLALSACRRRNYA
jgi:carbon-monoxide dehydrogenase large subunit